MNGGRSERTAERGGSLLEGLVSLALVLVIMAGVLPLLSSSRRIQVEMAWAGEHLQAARNATWRLQRDIRRAGFGCAGDLEAVSLSADGQVLELVHLEGGFTGGTALKATAAGQKRLAFSGPSGLKLGNQILIRDRSGRRFLSSVEGQVKSRNEVMLGDPLPFPVGSPHGSRIYRVKRERWRLEGTSLERNGQILVTGVRQGRFLSSTQAEGPIDRPLSPLLRAAALPPHLLGIRWQISVVPTGTPWARPGRWDRFTPAWRMQEMRESIARNGSPLP
ncbi:MAG: PilW family protein [Acidobacteriota bacterium]